MNMTLLRFKANWSKMFDIRINLKKSIPTLGCIILKKLYCPSEN
jgi:hypothetical protein